MSTRTIGTRHKWSAAVTTLLVVLTPAMAAQAAPSHSASQVSADPENWTPRVLDNSVFAVTQVGSRVVVGGDFTTIQRPGSNTPEINRPNLFSFDAATGVIDDSFVPVLNGRVQAVLAHPDGDKVWVAGAFSKVNGQNQSRVVLLNLATGQRVSTFASPSINAVVNDIRLSGTTLFIGGQFTTVGGQTRTSIASLNTSTGALTSHVTSTISGTNSGGTTSIRAMDVSPTGDRLVAVGNFSQVDGQPRGQIAAWDIQPTEASLSSWSTERYGNVCNSVFGTYMRDIDFSPDGSFFVVVTTGSYRSNQLCDTAARWERPASGAGQQPAWVAYTGGDTLTSVEITGPIAYIGGHMRWLNNPFAGDKPGSGAVPREGLAALDTRNGLPLTWNPGRQRGIGVWDLMPSATHLWAGSDTNYWANEYRPRVAGFPLSSGTPLPADQVGALPGTLLLVGRPSGATDELRQVEFNGSTTGRTSVSSGPETWSQARGAFIVDNQLFAGWSNNTFTVRDYDGSGWGPSQTIPLYEYTDASTTAGYLNNFVRDVGKITGIAYEPQDSRIYYTMSGSSALFWRYFTPESRIVGAQRFTVPNGSVISPSNVRGLFLSGNALYYSDQNGALRSIAFSRGTLSGTPTTVNTQIDWRSLGMAVQTITPEPAPNQAPTAAFTANCFSLTCSFDASDSLDPDGTVTDYQWSLGDGTQASGRTITYRYATAGTFEVTLTVTDNAAASGSTSNQVTVTPQQSAIEFRGAESAGGAASSRPSVKVPNAAQSGDTLLLVVSNGSSRAASVPAGWTKLGGRDDDELRTEVFWRTATASDAGSTVQVPLINTAGDAQSAPNTLTLAAYGGTSDPAAFSYEASIEERTTNAFDHTTPAVVVPQSGSWVISYWADRTSTTTSTQVTTAWQAPINDVQRAQAINTSTGARVTSLLTDSGTAVIAGPRDGLTASANGQTRKATMWSIVLAPAQ